MVAIREWMAATMEMGSKTAAATMEMGSKTAAATIEARARGRTATAARGDVPATRAAGAARHGARATVGISLETVFLPEAREGQQGRAGDATGRLVERIHIYKSVLAR